MDKMIKNLGNVGGPTPRRSDLTSQQRPTPRRGMPTPWRGREENLAILGYAAALHYSQHGKFWCFVLFCFSVTSKTCLLD